MADGSTVVGSPTTAAGRGGASSPSRNGDAAIGFLLQATYRVHRGTPVILLAGRLEGGESFLVRDRRERPRFWIPSTAEGAARRLGCAPLASDRVSMSGAPLSVIELGLPAQVPPLRRRLLAAGVDCLEADVPFATRYLLDRDLRGGVSIDGAGRPGQGFDRVFDEPALSPSDGGPALAVLSLDIETDPRRDRLLSVALSGCGTEEALVVAPPARLARIDGAVACDSEGELIERLVGRVAALDPDVLTGWNVVGFDLRELLRFARRAGVGLTLGRDRRELVLEQARGGRQQLLARLTGRVVLDGVDLLRGSFLRFESYALDAVAHEVLGRGKTLRGGDRVEEILGTFERDLAAFVRYNVTDARLVLEILDRLGLIELVVARSRLTGMTVERVAASIASFDFLYLSQLGRRGIVAPSVGEADAGEEHEEVFGGHVLDPRPGLYELVAVLDFRSLYPSLIRTFEIDPLGYVGKVAGGGDEIVAPNGAAFRRQRGILPAILDELMPQRLAAIAAGDRAASQAIKILMNSFYGVLGTPACRFYEPAIAGAITSFGRELLLWCVGWVEACGLEVLYGDTDSLFVATGADDREHAQDVVRELVPALNDALATEVAARWRVESRLELGLDRLFLRLHLPAARQGGGARKRYAGLADHPDGPRLSLVGLEAVRRDWTRLARDAQEELYRRLFEDRPLAPTVEALIADLRAGAVEVDRLVYRKRLRRPLSSYTSTTPPHVVAARQLGKKAGRWISYVMTVAGPQPVAERSAELDLEHYVQKQLRPVAEPILALQGIDFARLAGEETQLGLF